MPRPFSWLPRLHEIRRSVKGSVRSHYERKDIEQLFQVQPRSAQSLMQGISPSAKVGRSFLLARGDLEAFLDQIQEGAAPASLLSAGSQTIPRRRLRELVQIDRMPAMLETAPSNISFQPGQLAIEFSSMEQLAGALLAIAEILDNAEQFATFEDRYVPRRTPRPEQDAERAEIARLFEELEDMELKHAEHSVLFG